MWFYDIFTPPKKPIANRFLALFACFSLLGVGMPASAQASNTLTLEKAVSLTLQQHPDLQVFAAKQQEHQGYIQQSSVSSRPVISVKVEDVLGTGSRSNINSAQSSLDIAWVLEKDLVQRRVQAAKASATAINFEREIKALDLAAQTASLYVESLVLQQRLKLANNAKQQEQQILQVIEKRLKVGNATEVEKLHTQANIARRDLVVEDLEHELEAAIYQLVAQWNGNAKQYVLSGDLFAIPNIVDFEQQLKQLVQHPQIKAFANQQRILQSAIELTEVEKKPRWRINAGVRRFESTDDFGLTAGVSIPFGEDKSAQGAVVALQAKQAQKEAQAEALTHQIKTRLYVLLQEVRHSTHVIKTLSKQVLPLQKMALDTATQSYDMGRTDYVQWSAIAQEMVETQSQLLHAYHAIHIQNIELQRLTGVSVSK